MVASCAGLSLGDPAAGETTIVRGARRRSSFTVEDPVAVEPEDVDPEVTAAVLGAAVQYAVLVEGSIPSEIPHAIRFARRLAAALDGAALDRQTGQVWARRGLRATARPAPDTRVSTLELSWWCRSVDITEEAARTVLDAVESLLPEALPRRFGVLDPLQGNVSRDGRGGFLRAWREPDQLLATTGRLPCVEGTLSTLPGTPADKPFWHVDLRFLAEPMREPAWTAAARALLVRLVDELPTVYAYAQEERGAIWSGRALWHDSQSEWPLIPATRDGWDGLVPGEQWWTWLGKPYARWVRQLPPERTTATRHGLLYDATPGPGGAAVPLSEHLPQASFATAEPRGRGESPRVIPAPVIPLALQRPSVTRPARPRQDDAPGAT
ncbi:hypothetical protein [Arsenicicoccus dermatophilus]|uniref:hypothetical protein n=1 Tax=Arsenicicoccus dermatophilus TaxID=1076331 RepID=UPI0039174150